MLQARVRLDTRASRWQMLTLRNAVMSSAIVTPAPTDMWSDPMATLLSSDSPVRSYFTCKQDAMAPVTVGEGQEQW